MKLIFILSLIFSSSLFSFEFNSTWTKDFEKINTITCSEDDSYLCADLCGKSECQMEENLCRNCIGNDPYVASLFSTMGKVFRNNGVEISTDEFFYFLQDDRFIALNSKSVFNNIETFNSYSLRTRFRSLCPERTEYPTVLLELDDGNNLGQVRYVLCQSEDGQKIFEMSNDPGVIYNSSLY